MGIRKPWSAVLLSMGMLIGTEASALTLNFDVRSGWLANGTATSTAGACAAGALPGANGCALTFSNPSGLITDPTGYTTLSWGNGPTSSIALAGVLGGSLSDDGVGVIINSFFHFNNPITGTTLTLANAVAEFTVTSPFLALALNAGFISFAETPNAPPCPAPNPNGSTCDDIFTLGPGAAPPPVMFSYLGLNYLIDFTLVAVPGAGAYFDAATSTLYTSEGATNQVDVIARMRQVPEPGSLALLGLGLCAAGLARRRKTATS